MTVACCYSATHTADTPLLFALCWSGSNFHYNLKLKITCDRAGPEAFGLDYNYALVAHQTKFSITSKQHTGAHMVTF